MDQLGHSGVDFRHRDAERTQMIREVLEPILTTLANVESTLSTLNVFNTEERYRLAQARVKVLQALLSMEMAANTREENVRRAAESFVRETAPA